MEITEVKKFVDLIKETDIEEFNWESGETKVFIRKQEAETPVEAKPKAESAAAEETKDKNIVAIKSPMVGTFFRAQSQDYPPLVMEGNHVVPGQKVAIIEAMKIMKDVVSSVKGKIVKVLIENGQTVEYGKELFLVDTSDVK